MANIVIKKNFVDGDKLFSQQLNNNFETIEKGINDGNKIVWQDGTEVKFKRYVTNDINSLPILDGSIIYDTEKGRHYIDYQGKRVQVGSAGKEVLVQEEQPTEEDNKIWIDSDVVNTMGTEVVNSLDGNETNMAPSVNTINKLNKYSTEEQRIGTWIDGKPLYRKAIYISDLPSTADSKTFNIGSNIKTVTNIYGSLNNGIIQLFIGQIRPNGVESSIGAYISANNIIIEVGTGRSDYKGYAIVEYTKTTDSEVI